jgi:MoaA/NifB/PqqE/SkfB family radical SAM enzyme
LFPINTATIAADGRLHLSASQLLRTGLEPGASLELRETPQGLLLVPADPPLTKVYVEPTTQCNLACRTCVRHSWSDPIGQMSMDIYERLIDGLRQMPSLRKVAFWGFGEPLMHPRILDMIRMAHDLGAETEMITNGLLIDQKLARGLVACSLDTLGVSVDGATPSAYQDVRTGADLRSVETNIGYVVEQRNASDNKKPEIGVEFVMMRRNLHELPHLRRLARSLGASFVVVTNVLPYTEDLKDETLYGLWAGSAYPQTRSVWSPEIRLPLLDARHEVVAPLVALLEHGGLSHLPVGAEPAPSGFCRFVNDGSVAITWNGDVSPCVALMHSYSCYVIRRWKSIRHYSLGNLAERGIVDIWRQPEFVDFRRRVRAFEFSPCTDCGGCELVEGNEADCFGNPFPVCGDCLWARGVIQCP